MAGPVAMCRWGATPISADEKKPISADEKKPISADEKKETKEKKEPKRTRASAWVWRFTQVKEESVSMAARGKEIRQNW